MRTILWTQSRSLTLFLLVLPSIFTIRLYSLGLDFIFILFCTVPCHLARTDGADSPHKDRGHSFSHHFHWHAPFPSSISLSLYLDVYRKFLIFVDFFLFFSFTVVWRCQMKRVPTNSCVCLLCFVSHCMLNIYYIFYFPSSFLVLLSCVLDFHLVYSGTLLLARKNLLNIFYVHGTGYTRTHYTDTSINCMGERLTTVSIKSEKRSRSSRWSDQICVDIASFAMFVAFYFTRNVRGGFLSSSSLIVVPDVSLCIDRGQDPDQDHNYDYYHSLRGV